MQLLTPIKNSKISGIQNFDDLIFKLKNLIFGYDKNAELILFGSRARGDWNEESDWDFLILTDLQVTEMFKEVLRNKISNEIEIPQDQVVFVLVKNKKDWEENYAVTNIYESISEEGIVV